MLTNVQSAGIGKKTIKVSISYLDLNDLQNVLYKLDLKLMTDNGIKQNTPLLEKRVPFY